MADIQITLQNEWLVAGMAELNFVFMGFINLTFFSLLIDCNPTSTYITTENKLLKLFTFQMAAMKAQKIDAARVYFSKI
jgi:hypothetical protein